MENRESRETNSWGVKNSSQDNDEFSSKFISTTGMDVDMMKQAEDFYNSVVNEADDSDPSKFISTTGMDVDMMKQAEDFYSSVVNEADDSEEKVDDAIETINDSSTPENKNNDVDAVNPDNGELDDLLDSEEKVDDAIETINDPSTPENKKRGLLEKIRHSKWFIRAMGFIGAAMITLGGYGYIKQQNQNNTREVATEHNVDNIQDSSEISTDKTDVEKEYSFENHEKGDPIYINQEKIKEGIDKLEDKEHHLWNIEAETSEESLEKLREGIYTRPELVAGFLHGSVDGIEIENLDGEVIDFSDGDQVAQFIEDLNNNPEYYGQVYDAINEVVFDNIQNTEFYDLNKGLWSTIYRMVDKVDGKSKIAIDFDAVPNPGQGIKLTYIINGEIKTLYFRLKCAQKYTEREKTVIKVKTIVTPTVNIKEDEPDGGEKKKKNDDDDDDDEIEYKIDYTTDELTEDDENTNNGGEEENNTPEPKKETPDLAPKNPQLDIKNNKALPDQLKTDKIVNDGGYRPAEDATTSTYKAPAEPDVVLDQDMMNQIDKLINERENELNQSYSGLSDEELQTIIDNQNGQNEVNKSYEDAAETAQPVENGNQNIVNNENVGGF
ncbi:MAG: hypothetical protein Q3996_02285 [Candidatus Saccharibacteria bacterium]|nr:hypothetical protein [Candidatus Saccharibacteria bacterium]